MAKKTKAATAETKTPNYPKPFTRKLQVFSFDPLLATNLRTSSIARITIDVKWEDELLPGPVGEYIEVIDFDPASECVYAPIDLNHIHLLETKGLKPSESNPQFHQQMVYAVSMATIGAFEKALGRCALWATSLPRDRVAKPGKNDEYMFVRRLRIYPHALRVPNAYYDPQKHALLFGYFPSREAPGGETLPSGTVFTCLSYDIIAHETAHALLHGLHRYLMNPTNRDVLAFHEAFSDCCALFQHFSHAEVLVNQIANTKGDFRKGELFGLLAQQFGMAMGGGHRGALRNYVIKKPDATLIDKTEEPHDRGAILVAALFGAFLKIYEYRTEQLIRVATNGSGLLPDGRISNDLAEMLAAEAAKSAKHLLTMIIRAVDYIPPVDLTFGEYLRALITADADLVEDDDLKYRIAVIDSFRNWGIYPSDVNVLDESGLRWRPPNMKTIPEVKTLIDTIPESEWTLHANREEVFKNMRELGTKAHDWIRMHRSKFGKNGAEIGLYLDGEDYGSIERDKKGQPKFEVHSVRPCVRIGPDGQRRRDILVEIVQKRRGYFDTDLQKDIDKGKKSIADHPADFNYRGGCTLIIDASDGEIRYCIRKSVIKDDRMDRQRRFEKNMNASASAMYFDSDCRSPFAMLHEDHD